MISLQRIRLTLNIKKTEISRYNPPRDTSNLNFYEIGNEFMKILSSDDMYFIEIKIEYNDCSKTKIDE